MSLADELDGRNGTDESLRAHRTYGRQERSWIEGAVGKRCQGIYGGRLGAGIGGKGGSSWNYSHLIWILGIGIDSIRTVEKNPLSHEIHAVTLHLCQFISPVAETFLTL